jgi:nicotinamide-nucleotide amidase
MSATTALVQQLAQRLLNNGQLLAVAESCTGGLIAAACTDIAGSSRWFDRGWVTYSNAAKQDELAVGSETLTNEGAVSEATVIEMTAGVLRFSNADWAIAISGIAGPDGGSADKPVGTVWIAIRQRQQSAFAQRFQFTGDRSQIRHQAVITALQLLLAQLS